ncbi:LOW QUALITY PROTEIN: hypothetical protein QYF61_002144 [Mycteria americana]|uniref:Uncharacterized protein n=1 Tax=Mycteria americana TaxID=33587 RepID=A0AAN7NQE3_MYCAM|nr:LOW QUALITY PROTEIN: hypothetical protein QYF61_002144 [Mycteria americana]
MCTCSPESQSYLGLHIRKHGQQASTHETPIWSPALGSPVQERHGPVRPGPEEGHENDQRAGTLLRIKSERVGGCSAWRKEGLGEAFGELKKGRERHFTRACSDKTRINSFKLKEGRFKLDIRRTFVMMRVVRHWNRLLREVVDAPSLEVFKTFLLEYSGPRILCIPDSKTLRGDLECPLVLSARGSSIAIELAYNAGALRTNFRHMGHRQEISTSPSEAPLEEVVACDEVTPQPSLLQAEQANKPQLLLSRVVGRVTTMTQRNSLASNVINWRIPQMDKLNEMASSANKQRRFGNGAIFWATCHNLAQTCIYWKSRGREKRERERRREEERKKKNYHYPWIPR